MSIEKLATRGKWYPSPVSRRMHDTDANYFEKTIFSEDSKTAVFHAFGKNKEELDANANMAAAAKDLADVCEAFLDTMAGTENEGLMLWCQAAAAYKKAYGVDYISVLEKRSHKYKIGDTIFSVLGIEALKIEYIDYSSGEYIFNNPINDSKRMNFKEADLLFENHFKEFKTKK